MADYASLKKKIPDETYFKNFVALSKELAPDGDDISLVGLTIVREGKQKDVQFTRVRSQIISNNSEEGIVTESTPQDSSVELIGRLYAANEDQNNIRLKVESSNYSVIVPDGLGDIVKKYWGEHVKIKGAKIKSNVIKPRFCNRLVTKVSNTKKTSV
jgi:hypothetical protein